MTSYSSLKFGGEKTTNVCIHYYQCLILESLEEIHLSTISSFVNSFVNNTEDDDERMNYLDQYTVGEANKIVSGYGYLEAAMKELEERYGDVDVIFHAFITKALNWPTIKADNAKALDKFSVFLTECENAVQSMDALKILKI